MANQTEAAPAQATGIQQDRQMIRKPLHYTAQLDVLQILVRFLIKARDGAPFSYSTFKETWKQIGFSHVFQACPTRSALPSLINSLYSFLLDIIKAESLPVRDVFELANPYSPLNQQLINQPPNDDEDITNILPRLTPEDVAWATAPAVQGPPVVATSVYCLYSIYYAQPGALTVKIRISKEQQATITHLASYLAHSNALDALSLLKQLVKEKALLPGSSQHPDTGLSNMNRTTAPLLSAGGGLDGGGGAGSRAASTLAPGFGALYIVPGLRGEDAATVREVHFHLDSTLTGLGTAHLDPLCRGYGETLKQLWTALGQMAAVDELKEVEKGGGKRKPRSKKGGLRGRRGRGRGGRGGRSRISCSPHPISSEQQPEGIADLSLGKYLHEYATKKREEVQLNLQYGPNWREKLMKREKKQGIALAGPSTASPLPKANGGKKRASRARKRHVTAATAAQMPGVPGVSRQLLAREKARQIDMARRSKPWAERMGVGNIIEKELQQQQQTTTPYTGLESDEDMPFVPGLQSEFEYLAGRSDVGGDDGGNGGGSTKMTDTSIQGNKKGRKIRRNSSDSSSTSSSSLSSFTSDSSSSDGSSSDGTDSDGEEVEMTRGQVGGGGRGGKVVAARGKGRRAVMATAAAGPSMRGGKKGRGVKRGAGAGAAAVANQDVQNLLSEIDMALAEDARIQI